MKYSTFVAFTLCLVSASSYAATDPTTESLKARIHSALQAGSSLKTFYQTLSAQFGGNAVKPLIQIALDETNADEVRWASLFGLGKIAGKESYGVLTKFMSNKSWMLRDAALKTAAALNAQELSTHIVKRLKDDALIVRTTAVQVIGHLGLKKNADQLVEALFDQSNYNQGKPLWIHKYILGVIKEFKYQAAVPRLISLLESSKDEALQNQVVQTLESLTGKSFAQKSIKEQIYLWKRNTLSDSTF